VFDPLQGLRLQIFGFSALLFNLLQNLALCALHLQSYNHDKVKEPLCGGLYHTMLLIMSPNPKNISFSTLIQPSYNRQSLNNHNNRYQLNNNLKNSIPLPIPHRFLFILFYRIIVVTILIKNPNPVSVRLVFLLAMFLSLLHVVFPSFCACFFLATCCACSKIRSSLPKIGLPSK
jgi:hypothetical protein